MLSFSKPQIVMNLLEMMSLTTRVPNLGECMLKALRETCCSFWRDVERQCSVVQISSFSNATSVTSALFSLPPSWKKFCSAQAVYCRGLDVLFLGGMSVKLTLKNGLLSPRRPKRALLLLTTECFQKTALCHVAVNLILTGIKSVHFSMTAAQK